MIGWVKIQAVFAGMMVVDVLLGKVTAGTKLVPLYEYQLLSVPQSLELWPFQTYEVAVSAVSTFTLVGERGTTFEGRTHVPLVTIALIYFVPDIIPMELAGKVAEVCPPMLVKVTLSGLVCH